MSPRTQDERKPRVTCLIPCRNEAAYIEACLKAVLSQEQSEGGFEVVVADGISEDGTREIIKRIAAVSGPLVRGLAVPASTPSVLCRPQWSRHEGDR